MNRYQLKSTHCRKFISIPSSDRKFNENLTVKCSAAFKEGLLDTTWQNSITCFMSHEELNQSSFKYMQKLKQAQYAYKQQENSQINILTSSNGIKLFALAL